MAGGIPESEVRSTRVFVLFFQTKGAKKCYFTDFQEREKREIWQRETEHRTWVCEVEAK